VFSLNIFTHWCSFSAEQEVAQQFRCPLLSPSDDPKSPLCQGGDGKERQQLGYNLVVPLSSKICPSVSQDKIYKEKFFQFYMNERQGIEENVLPFCQNTGSQTFCLVSLQRPHSASYFLL